MPNWNVYKVFASGKRAKSPYTTFEADKAQHFFENILPTLTPKLKKSSWVILDVEASQERPEGGTMTEEDLVTKKRNRFLTGIAVEKFPDIADKGVSTCLMMNEGTDWKWAWCLAEGATHKFIGFLSEKFDTRKEAVAWIEEVGT
tara:strand:- start:6075 stop:6509 length:435 start_codon:yes stop_codon:yes gene_type:complete